MVRNTPGYLFTGYQIGAFDRAVNDYAAADVFNLSAFISQLGDANHLVGPQSGMRHFHLIPYNCEDSTSVLYNATPTWWMDVTHTAMFGTDGTTFKNVSPQTVQIDGYMMAEPAAWTTGAVVYAGTIELTQNIFLPSAIPLLSKRTRKSNAPKGAIPSGSLFSSPGNHACAASSSSSAGSREESIARPVFAHRMGKGDMAQYRDRKLKPMRARKLKPATPLAKPKKAAKASSSKSSQNGPNKGRAARPQKKNAGSQTPNNKGKKKTRHTSVARRK